MKDIWQYILELLDIICICAFLTVGEGLNGVEDTENRSRDEINLEGEWKVADYLASSRRVSNASFYQQYFGRSIAIRDNRILKSYGSWPDEMEEVISQYRSVSMDSVSSETYGDEFQMGERWFEKYSGQNMIVMTYNSPMEWGGKLIFYVTEAGEVLCWYDGDIFYMERYKEAETDWRVKQLYGEWMVKRLVSYQDGWMGRNNLWPNASYKEENGGFFYPENYIGDVVHIAKDSIRIYEKNRLLDSIQVNGYDYCIEDKYDYQNKRKIHDELGLTNEKILVFKGKKTVENSNILDGEIITVSDSEVIIKIYQGWYLMEKR